MKGIFLLKKLFSIALYVLAINSLKAQVNLVPNGSFEIVNCCPIQSDEFYDGNGCVPNWFDPTLATSDYFNICNPLYVPGSWGFYQYPKDGDAYGGFFTYAGSGNGREYIETPLTEPLQAGKKYCVKFYVNAANRMLYGTDAIGAYFSKDSLVANDSVYLYFPVQPQVENPTGNVITDTLNWILISGEFIAQGGEAFITIGSFKPNSQTNFDTTSWGTDARAYYYVDDVSVVLCDTIIPPAQPLSIPTLIQRNGYFRINGLPAGTELKIYNTLGQIVYESSDYDNLLHASALRSEMYICIVRLPDGSEQKSKLLVID